MELTNIALISFSGEGKFFLYNDLSKTLTCKCTLQKYTMKYNALSSNKANPYCYRIRVRIGPQNLWGTDRGTIKIPPCSKAISTQHRPKLCCPPSSLYKRNIHERDENYVESRQALSRHTNDRRMAYCSFPMDIIHLISSSLINCC